MAFSASRAKQKLERGVQLVSRPGFAPMVFKLSVVWSFELVVSPVVWFAARASSQHRKEQLVATQNAVRARALRWACPEFDT